MQKIIINHSKNNKNKLLNKEKLETLKGPKLIKFIAKTLPNKPGIYQMENEKGEILYIGKAKNLSKRVINYSSLNNLTRRLPRFLPLNNSRKPDGAFSIPSTISSEYVNISSSNIFFKLVIPSE